jgi:hypothetical protein
MRTSRILLVCALSLGICSPAFATQYWVVLLDKQPVDAAVIVKGPFLTRAEAGVLIRELGPVVSGGQYWVIRDDSGKLIVVDKKPVDAAVIVKEKML